MSGTRIEPIQHAERALPAERGDTSVVGDASFVVGGSTAVVGHSVAAVPPADADRATLDHPHAAFLVRERRDGPEGVTLPPRHEPGTAGPTSGQWGSG